VDLAQNADASPRTGKPFPLTAPARTPNWVSKTDLTTYLRCPYAFYLLHRRWIRFEDTVNDQQLRLIDEGVAFQAGIEAVVPRRVIEPGDLPRVFAEESTRLFEVPTLENASLEIYGKPDAVETAQGALFPVEIKSHKEVQKSDELELAFYWLVLERYRTKAVPPRGYLLLRRDGRVEQVEVQLKPNRFEQVQQLLQDIRHARQHGVPARVCRCGLCSGLLRDEIERKTRESKDLTRIWGIGPRYARLLEETGIKTYEQLATADPSAMIATLRGEKCCVSTSQIDTWKHHATSYSTSRPVLFGDRLPPPSGFIALDLEYVANSLIWLIGGCLITPRRRPQHFALWADTKAQETQNLQRLAKLAAANPSLPVVTWSGTAADMPQLRNAWQRLGLGQAPQALDARQHLDLYQYVAKAVRFPIPGLGLRDVASYFGIRSRSRIRDGLQALSVYNKYLRCRNRKKRQRLKGSLLNYNRVDLGALVAVFGHIAAIGCGDNEELIATTKAAVGMGAWSPLFPRRRRSPPSRQGKSAPGRQGVGDGLVSKTSISPELKPLARAAYQDDAARLILAGWLEEHGEPGKAFRLRLLRSGTGGYRWRVRSVLFMPPCPFKVLLMHKVIGFLPGTSEDIFKKCKSEGLKKRPSGQAGVMELPHLRKLLVMAAAFGWINRSRKGASAFWEVGPIPLPPIPSP
jgi:predicted RecB family nuclease